MTLTRTVCLAGPFVPADFGFTNMTNPWADAFPSVENINDLAGNVIDADFIGVKLGDVNSSAQANSLMPARARNLRGSRRTGDAGNGNDPRRDLPGTGDGPGTHFR